jgi:hypothetical protein
MSKLQEKPSALKREHPALQKMEFSNIFLCLWVIFALLDPDLDSESGPYPGTQLNPDPIRIHNTEKKYKFCSSGNYSSVDRSCQVASVVDPHRTSFNAGPDPAF